MTKNMSLLGSLLVSVAVTVGCGTSDGPGTGDGSSTNAHDDDGGQEDEQVSQGPKDFPAGVAALKECYVSIREALEANKPDDAHGPLHNVEHLLEAVTELAGKAELSAEDGKTVKAAIDRMFEAYGKIDSAMHDGKEPDYAAVSKDLDDSMAELESVLAAKEEK